MSVTEQTYDLKGALRQHFGFDHFKGSQQHIIENILAGRNFPSLDLEPIAVLLIDDLIMEVKKRSDLVFFHEVIISSDDIYVTYALPITDL